MTQTHTATASQFTENSQFIAKRQYLQPGETTIEDRFAKVAQVVSEAEDSSVRARWRQQYYDLMAEKKFCPGGRILAGAGTEHGQLLNCFVQGATEYKPDTFEGVMEIAKKLALVTKVGGGNGVNLDVLHYKTKGGHKIRDEITPRGVAYLRADHADVEDFIRCRARPSNQPDGDKVEYELRNWDRVIYGTKEQVAPWLALAAQYGVMVTDDYLAGEDNDKVMVPDDLAGIIDAAAANAAITADDRYAMPMINLTGMRPENTPIKGSGGTSSGPVSFLLEIFDNFLEWAARGAEKSGPIHTLRYVFAPVLRVVRQGGTRRGAGMATISIEHPSVLDFLTAKDLDREAAEGDISTFNVSILVSNKFMDALSHDDIVAYEDLIIPEGKYDYETMKRDDVITVNDVYDCVKAKWLWDQIAEHAWAMGEPGLIFEDRINEFSALKKLGAHYQIRSTNPCGEIPLTVGEPCDLGAINLAAYVDRYLPMNLGDAALAQQGPSGQYFHWTQFRQDIATCVRFLDNVLDVNNFPLEQNKEASHSLRRLGLGVMGLADMLIKLGLRYDSAEGRDFTFRVMDVLRKEAIRASEALGEERGVYPVYANLQSDEPAGTLWTDCRIPHAPRRNVALLTVAPTGTTSMVFDVSSGLEPVFSPFVRRKVGSDYKDFLHPLFMELLEPHKAPVDLRVKEDYFASGTIRWDWDRVMNAVSRNHGSVQGLDWVPQEIRDVFVCAHDVAPLDHVRMQGAVQRAFDNGGYAGNSLSKTINLPNSATVQDVKAAYQEAFTTGCKGITVYRDGSRQFQVLNTSKEEAKTEEPEVIFEGPLDQLAAEQPATRLKTFAEWCQSVVEVVRGMGLTFDSAYYDEDYLGTSFHDGLTPLQTAENIAQNDQDRAVTRIRRDALWMDATGMPELQAEIDAASPEEIDAMRHVRPAVEDVAKFLGYAAVTTNAEDLDDDFTRGYHQGFAEGKVNGRADATPAAPFKRPDRMVGFSDMVKLTNVATMTRQSYLVTVNSLVAGGPPLEVILTSGKAGDESNADAEALGRVVSIALQHGVPAAALASTLRGINGGLSGRYAKRMVTSKADLIAVALEALADEQEEAKPRTVAEILNLPPEGVIRNVIVPAGDWAPFRAELPKTKAKDACPQCDGTLIRHGGCIECDRQCGYSKCG